MLCDVRSSLKHPPLFLYKSKTVIVQGAGSAIYFGKLILVRIILAIDLCRVLIFSFNLPFNTCLKFDLIEDPYIIQMYRKN